MTAKSNIFICLLIVLVAAPLDTAVASWMALGMSTATQQDSMATQGVHAGHSQEMSHQHSAHDTHAEHDEEVCDEHCMNCSSHCFSPGLLSVAASDYNRDQQVIGNLRSHALHRADLLFRPPISA